VSDQLNPEFLAVKSDLKSALLNLGFKEKDVMQAISSAMNDGDGRDFSSCLKMSLNYLRSGKQGVASGSKQKTSGSVKNQLLDSAF
jgi:hypothetical protein